MTSHEIFSSNLSKFIKRRGITQADIARQMNVSTATVSGWFNGTKVPRMDKLTRLAEYLGAGIEHLMNENGYEAYDKQESTEMVNIRKLHMKKVPLLGSVAAGEPVNDSEFPDTFVMSPMCCDFALRVHGDSMQPSYLDGDIVYCKSCSALPYDGAVVVLRVGTGECTEHCIKHVIQTDAGAVIMSDNPAYPAKLLSTDLEPTVLGIPVGYTRMYEKNPPPWKG